MITDNDVKIILHRYIEFVSIPGCQSKDLNYVVQSLHLSLRELTIYKIKQLRLSLIQLVEDVHKLNEWENQNLKKCISNLEAIK